jgi:anthranilate synthase component 2
VYKRQTYNLVHLVEKLLHVKIEVFKNDEISLEEVSRFDKIILSPGPGLPDEAGIMKSLIKQYGSSKSILGVCLGHQAIGEVYGGKLINLDTVFHGVAHEIEVLDSTEILFKGLEKKLMVGRYHSWVVDRNDFPEELMITATDDNGNVMGLRHRELDIRGVQFHPESIMTTVGEKIISNWLFE